MFERELTKEQEDKLQKFKQKWLEEVKQFIKIYKDEKVNENQFNGHEIRCNLAKIDLKYKKLINEELGMDFYEDVVEVEKGKHKKFSAIDLKDMTAKEAHDYITEFIKHSRNVSDDEWLEISKWIGEFFKSNPPLEEKRLFGPLSCVEVVSIMCDGIIRWRNSICIKCRKQKGNTECHCEIYPENKNHTGIPNEIWAHEDAQCPYFEEEF